MKIKNLLAVACLTSTLLVGCKGPGDTVDFKFNVPKGTKFSYNIGMNMNMDQSIMGKEMKMATDITMGYVFEVVSDSAGWKTITSTISKIGMNMDAGGMKMNYDSDNPGADTSGPMAKVGKIFGAIKGGQFTFTMNENGEVGQVTGMQEMMQKMAAGMNPEDTMMANQTMSKTFNAESFKQNLQQSFALYPGKPVKVGESWNKTLTMDNNGMKMNLNNTYTLESVTGPDVKVKVASKITTAPGASVQGMQMDISGDMKGVNTFDLPTGMPVGGDDNMHMDMKMKMQGQEIPMKMDMKITITGKKI